MITSNSGHRRVGSNKPSKNGVLSVDDLLLGLFTDYNEEIVDIQNIQFSTILFGSDRFMTSVMADDIGVESTLR